MLTARTEERVEEVFDNGLLTEMATVSTPSFVLVYDGSLSWWRKKSCLVQPHDHPFAVNRGGKLTYVSTSVQHALDILIVSIV